MRLLSTLTGELQEFFDEKTPPYAILSHTWGNEEVSFQDLEKRETDKAGYSKIKSCCQLAASEGWQYVWIDTCCIDKSSSAELSEAINSMFRWYKRAQVCYAYLSDVDVEDKSGLFLSSIRGSRWFTRGWTLQELLAPFMVIFYDKNWTEIGTKASLEQEISSETGIQRTHLFDHVDACIAVKMSWASGRTTARLEDIAYCLLGLFDLNMPLLYGEGEKAFFRLQYELLQSGDLDESIFAWIQAHSQLDFIARGILAQSPAAFAFSGNIMRIDNVESHHRLISNLTRRSILTNVSRLTASSLDVNKLLLRLNCRRLDEIDSCLGIMLEKALGEKRSWVRADTAKLSACQARQDLGEVKQSEEILLSKNYFFSSFWKTRAETWAIGIRWPALRIDPHWKAQGFVMEIPLNSGCWTFRHSESLSMIAMLFGSSDGERFLIVFQRHWSRVPAITLDVVISNSIGVLEAMENLLATPPRNFQDTFSRKLQRGSQLTVKGRRNFIDNHVYHMIFVDIIEHHSIFELEDVRTRGLF